MNIRPNLYYLILKINYTLEENIINYLEKLKREKKDEEYFETIIKERKEKKEYGM